MEKLRHVPIFTIQKGIYNLLIKLDKDCRLKVGMLGTFRFPKGYYVYTGSAQNNMEKRIARHLAIAECGIRNAESQKENIFVPQSALCNPHSPKMHWHIDYLLKAARVIKVVKYAGLKRLAQQNGESANLCGGDECRINRKVGELPDAKMIVKGFGSSDCRCRTHLYFFLSKSYIENVLHCPNPFS